MHQVGQMRVKVIKINAKGQLEFKKDRDRRGEVHDGELKFGENRLHRYKRSVVTASVMSVTGNVPHPIIELEDAVVLRIDDKSMLIRGVEDIDGVQYAQLWDVRVI